MRETLTKQYLAAVAGEFGSLGGMVVGIGLFWAYTQRKKLKRKVERGMKMRTQPRNARSNMAAAAHRLAERNITTDRRTTADLEKQA